MILFVEKLSGCGTLPLAHFSLKSAAKLQKNSHSHNPNQNPAIIISQLQTKNEPFTSSLRYIVTTGKKLHETQLRHGNVSIG